MRDAHVFGRDVLDVEQLRQLALLDRPRRSASTSCDLSTVYGMLSMWIVLRRSRFGSPMSHVPRSRMLPTAGLVDRLDLVRRVENLAAGRKVRALDVAAQLRVAELVVLEQLDERRADLAEVVRRNVGRHADGDAGRAVDQQVRQARRQHDGLGLRAVVVRAVMHRVLLDLGEQLVADAREAALGVAHRRGRIAVERSEVARSVDERVAQRERLRHAHERLVNGRVAVRMEAAHHVADDLRALAVLGVGGEPLLPHRVQDAALHGLQPVAHIGQRARRDDRQRVVQISRLRRLVQRHGALAAAVAGRPAGLCRRIEIECVGGFPAASPCRFSMSHRRDARTRGNSRLAANLRV